MKRILCATVALALATALGGCTAIQRATGGNQASDASAFTYWSMWSEGEPQQQVLKKAIDEFTAETGVTVNVEWVGRDNIKKVSPTLNTAVSPVDLIDAAQRNVKSVLVSTGAAMPLNDVLDTQIPGESGTVRSVVPSSYVDMVTKDGNTWMVPYQVITSAFWYNGATHPDLAAKTPETWDELIAWLDKTKAAGKTPIAQDGDIANFNLYYYAELAVRNAGAKKLHEAAGDKTGEAFKSPEFLNAAKQVEQLVKGGYFAEGYSSSKWPAMQQKWAQGEAALIYNGTWIPHETHASAIDGFQYRAFPMPQAKAGGDMSQEVSFIGFGIPAKASKSDAAKRFIAYFMNKERISRVSSIASNLTPRSDVEMPADLADVKRLIDDAPAIHGQFDGIIDDYGDWTTKILIPLVNQLAFGTLTAEEFSAKLPQASADYWRTNG